MDTAGKPSGTAAQRQGCPRLAPLALAVALAWAPAASSNPTGAQVAAGAAGFSTAGKTLTVTNTPGTIINWQSFSIGAGSTTHFQQQSALSAVLNRVIGNDPSQILGTLSSNGRVFLVNPHGIVFGQGSVINTAGLVASTLNIRDEDFLAGRMKFEGGGLGALKNEGTLRASGDIFLVGPQIENAGLIKSENGNVVLAAGRSLTISSPDAHGVQFALQAPTDAALNLGAIEAKNAASMFAGTLRHSGEIRAVSASVDASGRVTLAAQKDAIVAGNSLISVDNSTGRGGRVEITGERVGLFDNATVSARGAAGGEILVGGDYQGANPAVRNAQLAHVAPGVTLDAGSATGSGGRVIVWADGSTRAHGSIITSGAQGGGLIETSGKRHLDVGGIRIDAGRGGSWLLDPYNIEVVAGNGLTNNSGATAFTPGGDNSQIGADLIVGQLDAGTSVTLNTAGAGAQAGNITVSSAIVKTASNTAGFNLIADNDINVNANIDLGAGAATANFNAGGNFTINNATVSARNIHVTADSIQRSGAQANDFSFSHNVAGGNGMFRLTATTAGVGSAAEAIRFNDNFGYHDVVVSTSAAGAAGNIHLNYTGTGASYFNLNSNTVVTDAATSQTVALANSRSTNGDIVFQGLVTGNDHWIINTSGNLGFSYGAKLIANSITGTMGGDITYFNTGGNTVSALALDTSAANGNITLTAGTFTGTGCGGNNWGVGVAPGAGTVTATSTGGNPSCGGSIQLTHFGGDMLTSRYVLNFTGGGADNYMRLKAYDGHLIVDDTTGFNASLNDKNVELHTLTAGKDIVFAGGTVSGLRMNAYSAGNIDNLAPGVTGFAEICPGGACEWRMHAAGGIGLTNPIDAQADWVGGLQSGGVGSAGNIRVNFTSGPGWMPRLSNLSTHSGSAQTITLAATGNLSFNSSAPGFGGAVSVPGDTLNVNVTGDLHFQNAATPVVGTFNATAGNSMLRSGGFVVDWISASNAVTLTATAGSIGSAADYATFPGAAGITATAAQNIYLDAGANPLSLAGITTGAGVGTIGLRNSGANDITIGGTNAINDNLILSAGRDIIFPAAANFSTSGGLALNSPTQIAATASVAVTGGTFSAASTINNAGTLTKANSGTTTFSAAFTNSGTLNVNAGTLNMNAGMTQTAGGISIGSGATLRLPPGTTSTWNGGTLTQAALSSTLRLDDSTLTLNSNITNSGTLHLQNFSTLNGTGTVTNTGDLNIYGLLGSLTPVVFAANLVNQGNMQTRDAAEINGTFTNAAGGTFLNNDSGTLFANGFTNAGSLLLYSDANYEPLPVITINSGTLLNTGTISTIGSEVRDRVIAGQFNNQGTVTTSVGRLVINKTGAAHVNSGTMNATGADILVQQGGGGSFTHSAGTITVGSGRNFSATGGVYDWQGGTLAGAGGFTPSGGMTLSGSGARVLNGPTLNLGATTLSGGSLLLQSGALNFGGIATIGPAATLEMTGGTLTGALSVDVQGLLKMNGGVLNAASVGLVPGGTLAGNGGTINAAIFNGGTVAVGASPGALTVNGNYAQGPTGVLNVELGGTTQGVDYDLLQVNGTASLGGTMNVTMFGGFTGAVGNVFDVITYSSRTGDFATINFPSGFGMTATPNTTFYQLAIGSLPAPGAVTASVGATEAAILKLPAGETKILNDKFLGSIDAGKKPEDEEKKGAVLECR